MPWLTRNCFGSSVRSDEIAASSRSKPRCLNKKKKSRKLYLEPLEGRALLATLCDLVVRGVVYEDTVGNGQSDENDPSLSGFVVELDINSDGTVDQTTVTNDEGDYEFRFCAPDEEGVFTVRQNLASNPDWIQNTADHPSRELPVPTGTNFLFGNFRRGGLSGYLFDDVNGNKVDDGEPRLTGAPIRLERDLDGDGTIDETIEAITSNVDATYSFSDLGPGRYRVNEEIVGGVLSSPRYISLDSRRVYMAIPGQTPVEPQQFATISPDLAVGIHFPVSPIWQNHLDPKDVDESGSIFPRDVLLVINELNGRRYSLESTGQLLDRVSREDFLYDVNGDNYVTSLDALIIINHLNNFGEGESVVGPIVYCDATGCGTDRDRQLLAATDELQSDLPRADGTWTMLPNVLDAGAEMIKQAVVDDDLLADLGSDLEIIWNDITGSWL